MLTKLRKLGGDLSAADGLLDLHNQTVFEVRSVAEVTWGYQHPLVDLANQVLPEEEQLPPLYGYFYGEKPPLALASTVYCQNKYFNYMYKLLFPGAKVVGCNLLSQPHWFYYIMLFYVTSGKNNSAGELFTILTGATNLTELGSIVSVDNETELTTWEGEECNRIRGSDGRWALNGLIFIILQILA